MFDEMPNVFQETYVKFPIQVWMFSFSTMLNMIRESYKKF